MPVSASVYAMLGDGRRIVGVALSTKYNATDAAAMTGTYYELSVTQATAASIDKDEDINDLVGRHVDASGFVSTFTESVANQRSIRRGRINALIREGLTAIPPVAAGKDDAANSTIHKYLRMCYAASQVDANVEDETRFGWIEDAAKGGSLTGGIRAFFKALAIAEPSSAYVTGWTTALADSITEVVTVDSSGNHTGTTASLPSGWATSRSYEPANAL